MCATFVKNNLTAGTFFVLLSKGAGGGGGGGGLVWAWIGLAMPIATKIVSLILKPYLLSAIIIAFFTRNSFVSWLAINVFRTTQPIRRHGQNALKYWVKSEMSCKLPHYKVPNRKQQPRRMYGYYCVYNKPVLSNTSDEHTKPTMKNATLRELHMLETG